MRYLIGFLVRSRVLILFLFLQVIALILTINSRSFQRSSFLNSSSAITGNILLTFNNYSRYIDLNEQNENLLEENARLNSLTKSSYLPISTSSITVEDTFYRQRYQYINANIINSSYLKTRNFITLDKGSAQGITPGMGLVGPDGVVGQIKEVSTHFSTATPIINPDITTSGTLLKTGNFGPTFWKNSDYRFITLEDIPKHVQFENGDSVVTNSKSGIFPSGLLIGTVESYELQSDQNFNSLKLKLATDFSSIQQVYIVKDKMKLELQELEDNLE